MKQDFNDCLAELVHHLTKEQDDKTRIAAKAIIQDLNFDPGSVKNPEEFYLFFQAKLNDVSESVAKTVQKNLSERLGSIQDQNKLVFLYTHYNFMKCHIENVIETRVGHRFSADQSRHILKLYLKKLIGKEKPVSFTEDHFWIPRFGEYADWMEFCDCLYMLYHGHPEEYLHAYKTLIDATLR